MSDDQVLDRLDLIQATLQMAFAPQLEAARDEIRADYINAAILDATDDWVPTTELQKTVASATGKSERSVRDRLPTLVQRRVLAQRGTERRSEYRRTGLV